MPLSLQHRRVGDITVVKCIGRIVEGAESAALKQYLDDLLRDYSDIILDLDEVQFIDSGGLGLLVRLHTRARAANGDLKLCAVPAKIGEVLRITHLSTIFESHGSEAEAISAFYQPSKSSGVPYRFDTDILCVETSADVLAYVRELLKQAGYGVTTADNLPDALTLLNATRPKMVVISADLRAATGTQTADAFQRLADARSVVELPADFSSHDAGEAGHQLLDQIRALMGPGGRPAPAAL